MSLTVGALRLVLAGLPDDLDVGIPGGEYDYQNAVAAHVVKGIEWVDENAVDFGSDNYAPEIRDMLVIDL